MKCESLLNSNQTTQVNRRESFTMLPNIVSTNSLLPMNLQLQQMTMQPVNLRSMLQHSLSCALTSMVQSQALSSLTIAPVYSTSPSQLQVTAAVSHLTNNSGQRVQQSASRRDVTSSVTAFDRSTLAPQRLTQSSNEKVCRPLNANVHQVPTGNRSCSSVVSDPPKRSRRSRDKPKVKTPSGNPDAQPRDRKRNRTTSQTNSRKQKAPDASPQTTGANRYKTELCRSFEESGVCRYGEKCQFAHGRAELRSLSRHPKYKTELCRTFHSTAFCPYGQRCHFVHDEPRDEFMSTHPDDEVDTLIDVDAPLRSRNATQDCPEQRCSINQSFCQDVDTLELLAPSSLIVVATRSDDEGLAASCTSSTCSPVKLSNHVADFAWTRGLPVASQRKSASIMPVSKSYSLSTSSDEDSGCALYFGMTDLPLCALPSADDAEETEPVHEPEDGEDYGDAFDEMGNAFGRLSLDGNNNVLDVNNQQYVDVNNNVEVNIAREDVAEWTSYNHEVAHSPARSRSHSQQDELETSEKRLPIFASLAGTLR